MPEPFTIEDLNRIPQYYIPTLNHAKDTLAFYWDRTGRVELYTLKLEDGAEPKQVSAGQLPKALRSSFEWTRDDASLIFAKDDDGNEKHDLFRLDIASGEVIQLTSTPDVEEHAIDTSPDGKWLLVMSTRNGQMNLFRLDLEDPAKVEELTSYERPVMGAIYDQAGERIFFSYNDSEQMKNFDIWVCGADGSDQRKIYSAAPGSVDIFSDVTRDGRFLAITSDAQGPERPGVLDLETNEVRWFGEGRNDEYSGKFTRDGKWLVCLTNKDAVVKPRLYEVATGRPRDLQGMPAGIAAGTGLALDDRYLILTLNTATSPSVLIQYDLQTDTSKQLLEPDFGPVDPNAFVTDEYIRFTSPDGLEIGAILYRPRDIPAGTKIPALVDVHGGPWHQYFRSFSIFGQVWAARGYAVLLPNFRGSTGYGREFMEANMKDWGGGDLEDVVAGREYLASLDYVDENRIGVYGGSFGGYMTYMQMTHRPDKWAAGCAWIGISELLKLYEESEPHFKYFFAMQMGDPEENKELWKERSALYKAQDMTAPLLIVHGVNDPRCPISQARMFRDRLIELGREEGKDFEYVEYGDEGHAAWTDQESRIRTLKLMTGFFDKHLKGNQKGC